jgi:hypothetical protein
MCFFQIYDTSISNEKCLKFLLEAGPFGNTVQPVFLKNSNLFLLKFNFFMFLNRFDVLILKIIFLK